MSLQYLETNVIGAYLVDAWQNQLQTEIDPTSGRWFRQGPNNGPGLFGGLTDLLITDLAFDKSPANVNRSKDVALTTTLDNRSGLLNESAATNTLSWQVSNTVSTTQSKTNSIKNTVSEKVTVKVGQAPFQVDSETVLAFEYAYSWTNTEAVTTSDTKTFTASLPLKVPQGKAYKLVVLADRSSITIPYSANIRLKGVSEANFPTPINGQTHWSASAGEVCAWIKKHGSAKGDAMEFDADPDNPSEGMASIRGVMRVDQSVNFTIFAIDVTSTLAADPSSSGTLSKLLNGQALPADQVVATQPVAA